MLGYPGCSGWHGAGNAYWINSEAHGFVRGSDGVFSFYGDAYGHVAWVSSNYCGRGVTVVGTGL